jgi:hypothetical protein
MSTAKLCALSLAVMITMCGLPARAQDNPLFPEASPQALYIFSEHLPEANAEIYFTNKETRKGIWEQDQFQFYGLQEESQIRMVSGAGAESENAWQAIQMNSLPRSSRKLQYLNVTPGHHLNVYYRVELKKEDLHLFQHLCRVQGFEANTAFFARKGMDAGHHSLKHSQPHEPQLPGQLLFKRNRQCPTGISIFCRDTIAINI